MMEQQQQQQMYSPNPDPRTGLEESFWQLGLTGGGGGSGLGYPERPGEPDCMHFMRTGTCGYGDRCRFNHPRNRPAPMAGVTRAGGEYPERHGQPVCQYFLKTGTCKFGATCKYHHPKQGGSVALNIHGYPLRLGEKECSYYVKTGLCKFGVTCKFHHPQPVGSSFPPVSTFYPAVQSPVPSPHPYPTIASWPAPRPQLLSGSYMQGGYGSVVLSPGFVPFSGWSPYPPPVSSVISPGVQHNFQAGSMYGGAPQRLSASAPAYLSQYPSTSSSSAGPSSSSQKEHNFPERPGQPECQFYMRTGDCKFGPTCKYHHPPEWSRPKSTCALSSIGLPLRPGAPPCTYYAQRGVCKFGPTCKFDHPMGMLRYSPSATSLTDMPVAPYPVGYSITTLAPSKSSLDLRPEFSSAPSQKDSFSTLMPLSGHSPSGSIGSIFSSHSFVNSASGQISTSLSSSSAVGQGGGGASGSG